ncbi:hypothetical protein GCM10007941_16920 [Amphritea balenae]|nr:hypothetical protein GCM10007941_16920 [Amphritea balenae]
MNVLVPVRMGLEGMATDTIGMVLSLYFVGMLIGAFYSKQLVQRVGHIRTFAGSVAIEAICILAFALDADPWLWGGLRILLGFSQACLLTAMESWLSDSASEDTRGKILAVYHGCVLVGLFGGQFLIGVADPAEDKLFIIVGILFSLAALPVLFSRAQAPSIEAVVPMSIVALFRISPLGVASCLVAGIVYSALFNLLPVFAAEYQIVGFQLSVFMGCAIFGAFILQFPVGYLSDRFDRRTVLFVLLIISSVAGLAVIPLAKAGMIVGIFVLTGLTAGIIACFYPLSIAEAFDKLKRSEMVSAMGSMLLAFGIGGAVGPYTGSLIMELFGGATLFYFLAVSQMLLALFTLYRMTVRKALPIAEQEGFVMQGAAISTALDLDPRTEYIEPEAPLSQEAEAAITIAESDPAAAVKMARAMVINNPEKGAEVAAAVATVPGIDVMRLYEVLKEAAPYQILETTQAIVKAKPDLAGELVSQLAEWYPQQVVAVAIEIGRVLPELRIEMARIAADSAPESATQVAEYYSRVIAEEREAVRPADRESDTSEVDALNIVSELWEASPEQALDVAAAMVDAVPETAVSVAEEYIANAMHEQQESVHENNFPDDEVDYQSTVDLVARISEIAPEQALDVAVAVVEAIPDSAADVAAEVAGNIGDDEIGTDDSDTTTDDVETVVGDVSEAGSDNEAAVELVQRLSEAAPDNVLDIAAAVVEAVPDSAAGVAAEVAGNITDNEDGSESSVWAGDSSDNEAAVELTQRLSEAAPDNVLDVAAAIAEALPESAGDVAAEVASNITDNEDGTESSVWAGDSSDNEAAVELTQRLSEAAPDNVLDVAAAIAEALPESAGDVAAEVASNITDNEDGTESSVWAGDSSDNEAAVELTQRLSEAAPDNVLDVAAAVAEVLPESAGDIAAEVAGNISDNEDGSESSVWAGDSSDNEAAVELTQRLSEAAPDNVLDVAAAVAEALPESAGEIAAEVAGNITDNEDGSESSVWAGDSSDNEAAVELTQRLSEAAPDNVLDVAAAIAEALPESAGDVAAEVAGNITENEDGTESSVWAGDSSDSEAAVELTQRLSEAAPDNVMDVAVAIVEAVPEAASDVLDEISSGNQACDGEWMDSVDDKPETK